jgi:hypothetical protein
MPIFSIAFVLLLSCSVVRTPNLVVVVGGVTDELHEQQEELLVQERKISEELKKLLALEKGKVEKLDQELAKSKETTCSLKRSIGAL